MHSIFERLRHQIETRADYYRSLYEHPRTPTLSKWLLGLAIAYTISVIDVIPDFIPELGYVDDLVIVSGLFALALWMIPEEVKLEFAQAQPRPMVHL
jgi:uncharacterized membrane protein YkvA (DUF1232 family)